MSGDIELNPGPQGNKHYLCTSCGKSFSFEADLQKHTIQAHDDRTFKGDFNDPLLVSTREQPPATKRFSHKGESIYSAGGL